VFWLGLGYLFLIWLGLIVDDYILTKRHVRMFKEVMTEELRKLKAESLSIPGGSESQIETKPFGDWRNWQTHRSQKAAAEMSCGFDSLITDHVVDFIKDSS
jgi:hypothetical protein